MARQMNRLGIEFELAGFDLRYVEHLVDEAKEVGSGGTRRSEEVEGMTLLNAIYSPKTPQKQVRAGETSVITY